MTTTYVQITGTGVTNPFGQALAQGTTVGLDTDLAKSLIACGKAVQAASDSSAYQTGDAAVVFIRDATGKIVGYTDLGGIKRTLDGLPLRSDAINGSSSLFTRGRPLGPRGCVFGASTVLRTMTQRGWNGSDYSRSATGLVTLAVNNSGGTTLKTLPGHWVQVCNAQFPDVEYLGPVNSVSTVNGGSQTVITYQDIPNYPLPACPFGGDLHDMATGTVQGNWKVAFDVATGGRCDVEVIGCGGSNLQQWDAKRLKRLTDRAIANGGFDFIFVGGSSNLVNNAALGATRALAEMTRVVETLLPFTRQLILEPPEGGRGAVASTAVFTSAMRVMRQVYTEVVRAYPNVRICQIAEILGNNWSPYNVTTPLDVKRSWAPALWMNSGNAPMVHYNWPAACRQGIARAAAIAQDLPSWSPENGAFPDNRVVNSIADWDGGLNPNLWAGFFGAIGTKTADAPATGKQPTGTSFTVATPGGGMAAVMSLPPNFEGGTDWLTIISDTSGAANGTTFTFSLTGASTTLQTFLNQAANQGKRIRLFAPIEVSWDNEYTVTTVELGLFCTVGGVEYNICAPLSNDGLFKLPGIGVTHNGATDALIGAGGSGYQVNDVLIVSGGTQTTTAKFTVTQVSAGAVVDGYFSDLGDYTVTPANNAATTGGSGSGCTLNITWLTLARSMDWGICGTLRDPSPFCYTPPIGSTVTAADLRLVIFGGAGSTPMGELRVRIGRDLRIELVDW